MLREYVHIFESVLSYLIIFKNTLSYLIIFENRVGRTDNKICETYAIPSGIGILLYAI